MNDLDQVITFVFEGTREERLDKVLVQHLSDFSRARLQNLIKEGKVCLNGRVITKTGFPVQPGQQIQVTLPPPPAQPPAAGRYSTRHPFRER
jgi:23S rRNA pseudouridine1911/1915/1917 synthase